MRKNSDQYWPSHIALVILILVLRIPFTVSYIDCYVCSSVNQSNSKCEDPFFPSNSQKLLKSRCFSGRKLLNEKAGYYGLFPATHCIKIAANYLKNSESIVIRTCALDSRSVSSFAEITRHSHCGYIRYNGKLMKGCVMSCKTDGCNSANHLKLQTPLILLSTSSLYILIFHILI